MRDTDLVYFLRPLRDHLGKYLRAFTKRLILIITERLSFARQFIFERECFLSLEDGFAIEGHREGVAIARELQRVL